MYLLCRVYMFWIISTFPRLWISFPLSLQFCLFISCRGWASAVASVRRCSSHYEGCRYSMQLTLAVCDLQLVQFLLVLSLSFFFRSHELSLISGPQLCAVSFLYPSFFFAALSLLRKNADFAITSANSQTKAIKLPAKIAAVELVRIGWFYTYPRGQNFAVMLLFVYVSFISYSST